MPKRFVDTNRWRTRWFRSLTPTHKLFWEYINDNCDHAGIWEVDFGLASYQIGVELDEEEVKKIFGAKVTVLDRGEKWFINNFVDFQYGDLKQNNNAHLSVARILSKHGLLGGVSSVHRSNGGASQPLVSPWPGHKDQDQAKALVTDKAQEKAQSNQDESIPDCFKV